VVVSGTIRNIGFSDAQGVFISLSASPAGIRLIFPAIRVDGWSGDLAAMGCG